MIGVLIALALGAGVFAAVLWFFGEGVRNGDWPDDTRVGAGLRRSGQPGEERPVAVVAVRNQGAAPVLVAVSVRRALLPGWLAGPVNVSVPRRTARRAFRPDGYPTVGVVLGGESAELTAPVPSRARRYLLTVLVGQGGGRLRVHRLRMDDARRTPPGRVAVTTEQGGHR
jgi:hypothetical protein